MKEKETCPVGRCGCCCLMSCDRADKLPPCVKHPKTLPKQPKYYPDWRRLYHEVCRDVERTILREDGCALMRKYCLDWRLLYLREWSKLNPCPPTIEEQIESLEKRIAALEATLAEKGITL